MGEGLQRAFAAAKRSRHKVYYVSFARGATLVRAASPAAAKRYWQREFGVSDGPYVVTLATEENIEWVTRMGGKIHETS